MLVLKEEKSRDVAQLNTNLFVLDVAFYLFIEHRVIE